MQNNVIDLIIYLVKRIHIGAKLKDIKLDKLRGYNHSEISAAYSWLIQKHESGEFIGERAEMKNLPSPRVLHPNERSRVSSDAYGYILELYYIGILDARRMERLIEYAMLRLDKEVTDVADVKEWVAGMIFDSEYLGSDRSLFLKGNENIN
ncbi:MAG: DUF494 family protein [Balneolaceae bacterium]|nr:MAG: DUF494 family protein [Balneolaceae bacterium]